MGARLSSDNSESPGSVSGVLAGTSGGGLRGGDVMVGVGNSASAGATPTRHPSSGAGASMPVGVPQGESQLRLQRMLMRRQQQQQQYQSGGPGSSSGQRSSHPRSSSRASTSATASASMTALGRQRPRSFAGASHSSPGGGGGASGGLFFVGGAEGGQEAHTSSEDEDDPDVYALRQLRQYIPLLRADVRCRMCNKMVPYDDHEIHYVMCLTKPRVAYNEDVLHEDKGECAICLEDLNQGDTIARLPCLCVYHKGCIDEWFKRSHTCPEHPGD